MAKDDTPEKAPLEVIRLFPDYAHTVIWLDQPIRYRETGLTSELTEELSAWEQSYYDSLTDNIDWVSAAAARAFTVEGTRLAHRVAAEVGPRFVVEFASYENGVDTLRVRSEHPTENPEAVSFSGEWRSFHTVQWRPTPCSAALA